MGLLDSLFDQSSYGGQGGGLLDFLRQSQMQQEQYQPSAGFPQAPASFADRFNAMPGAPQPVAPSGRSFDNAQFDPQTFAPNQAQPIAVGSNYQMPRLGNADQFIPQQAMTPPNAQPAQGHMPVPQQAPQAPAQQPQGLPPAFGGGSILGRLGNPDGLIARLTGNDSRSVAQQNLKAQYDALVPLLGQQKAMLAVLNKEAGQTLINEALTNKEKYTQTGEDSFGNKQYGFVNEREQTINGKPIGAGEASAGSSFLATGVKQIDSSLTGGDYLKQFSPEVQAAVKDYVAGRSMPTGNPRKGFTQTVKMIAQKYGSDVGQPADDTTFASKRQMMTDLSKSSPNSAGGIISNGKSAFTHLSEAAERMAANGNYNGPDVPGGHAVSSIGNYFGNSLLPTPDTAAKLTGISDNLLKYGQEATKFYAGTGGGEAERMHALKTMDPTVSSGKQQAEFLETEKGLMLDRLRAKENQVREQLGQEYLDKHPIITGDVMEAVAKIDANVKKLRGEPGAAPAQAGGIPSGWSVKVR